MLLRALNSIGLQRPRGTPKHESSQATTKTHHELPNNDSRSSFHDSNTDGPVLVRQAELSAVLIRWESKTVFTPTIGLLSSALSQTRRLPSWFRTRPTCSESGEALIAALAPSRLQELPYCEVSLEINLNDLGQPSPRRLWLQRSPTTASTNAATACHPVEELLHLKILLELTSCLSGFFVPLFFPLCSLTGG